MDNSTPKHTPGEWNACKSDGDKICIRAKLKGETEGFRRIAHLNEGSASGYIPEDYANANLIAAAPELLELLKEINYAFYVKGTTKALKEVMVKTKPLIAKAEGRA